MWGDHKRVQMQVVAQMASFPSRTFLIFITCEVLLKVLSDQSSLFRLPAQMRVSQVSSSPAVTFLSSSIEKWLHIHVSLLLF